MDKTYAHFKSWLVAASKLSLLAASCTACLLVSTPAMSAEEKVFRTGLMVEASHFSVSPDGEKLVFNTKLLAHGMRLLDLKTGKITTVPAEPDRRWEMPRWSMDGKYITAVSTVVKNNMYIVGEMQVIVIDPHDWSHRAITSGEGVKIFPILSAKGEKVYYFKGKTRTTGRTPASGFDLYFVDLSSGHEEKLTDESFYQAETGDVDDSSGVLLVYGIGTNRFKNLKDIYGTTAGFHIFSFDTRLKRLSPLAIDSMGKISSFSHPRIDKLGRLYFKAAMNGNNGFVFSIFRDGRKGESPIKLTGLPIWGALDIATRTGEMFVSDTLNGELIFRRLAITANQ